jgi:hypothetical protein
MLLGSFQEKEAHPVTSMQSVIAVRSFMFFPK